MINLLRWFTRVAGLGALALGIVLWLEPGVVAGFTPLLQIHMTLGGIVALSLAILAVRALAGRVRVPAAIAALVWAVAMVYVGTLQNWWVAAGSHWVLEVIHPLLGIGAIGLAEMLAAAIIRAAIVPQRASLA
jgi:hypothetical protein